MNKARTIYSVFHHRMEGNCGHKHKGIAAGVKCLKKQTNKTKFTCAECGYKRVGYRAVNCKACGHSNMYYELMYEPSYWKLMASDDGGMTYRSLSSNEIHLVAEFVHKKEYACARQANEA